MSGSQKVNATPVITNAIRSMVNRNDGKEGK